MYPFLFCLNVFLSNKYQENKQVKHTLQRFAVISEYDAITSLILFQEHSQQLGDDKSLSEHLKLPIQRINDYQLLLKVSALLQHTDCPGWENSSIMSFK